MTKHIRKTKNIRLATCWMALGAKYEGVDRTDTKHQEFEFSVEDELAINIPETGLQVVNADKMIDLDKIENELANRTLMINADDLFNAFQRLKSIIHSK